MSLEQKVGQMFIVGFSGKTFSKSLRHKLDKIQPGAIIVFKRNLKNPYQIASLNAKAQEYSLKKTNVPLLIMVDQEGGQVTRIKSKPNPPSALSIGMTQNPMLAERAGAATGKILRLLGFNQNLAPVVDISDPFIKSFIGSRAFGDNPDEVQVMGHRFSTGLLESGVLPTFKHFPGHGGQIADSHKKTPKKNVTLTELLKKDLKPFKYLSDQGSPSSIMVAHIAYPNIDSSGLPATFSSVLIKDILRKKLNYNGLVITDDIEMTGAKVFNSVGERAIRAIEAGNDMVMVAWTQRRQTEAYNAVLKAVKSGRISEERIDESIRRILLAKSNRMFTSSFKYSRKKFKEQLLRHVEDLRNVTNEVAQRNVDRAIYNLSRYKGTISRTTPVYVFSAYYSFYKSIAEAGFKNPLKFYRLTRKKASPVNSALAKNSKAIGFYYITGAGTARELKNVKPEFKRRLIVINSINPGVVDSPNDYRAVVNINSKNYRSGEWISKFFIEESERLPASK